MQRHKGHKLLSAADADEEDRIIAGQSYSVRYLGKVEIPSGNNKGATDQAVEDIYNRYSNKAKLKSLTMKELFVSANCISIREPNEGAVVLKYSTVNVTFCGTNGDHQNAFVFIGRCGPSSPLNAHVVHCASPAKATEIYTAMSQAFSVRCCLYQAKRIEKAGWLGSDQEAPDHYSSQNRKENAVGIAMGKYENHNEDMNNNNNKFGNFACVPKVNGLNDTQDHSACNGSSTDHKSSAPMTKPSPDMNNRNGKKPEFPLAKVLLGLQMNRGRSHSWHSTPYQDENQGMNRSNGLRHSGMNVGMNDDEDVDAFSIFARERSSSLVHLVS